MSETEKVNGNTPQFDDEVGDKLFVFDKLDIRRRYPVNIMMMGAMGDLCLTRVNKEIFDYIQVERTQPINRVFMCDVLPGPHADYTAFLKALYDKCCGYNCLESYFTKECIQEVERIQKNKSDSPTPDETDEQLSDYFDKLLTSIGDHTPGEQLGKALTELGVFLFYNYEVSKTSTDLEVLFSGLTDNYTEMDWIFYLCIPPSLYKGVINSIIEYYKEDILDESSSPAKIFLLEYPLEVTSVKAKELADYLISLHGKKGLYFFAINHYMVKWSLWELPVLIKTIPNFSKFIEAVDEIIIELLEDKIIPDLRLYYMAPTGVFYDMMPHILLPLQYIFAGKDVRYKAKKIVVSYYKGYEEQVGEWLKIQSGENIYTRPETYFSLKLELTVINKKDSQKRKVDVFVRAGKGMFKERKRVIIKRHNLHKPEKVGIVTIDIKEDKYEHSQDSGVSLPVFIRQLEAERKHIRGHARILHYVMDYLKSLPNGTDSSREVSRLLELSNVKNAAKIIECIESIQQSINDWPRDFSQMQVYEKGTGLVLDSYAEEKFLHPFK